MEVTNAERGRYYEAALIGLAALDAQAPQPRRFGVDADARWRSFRGALETWDRIDLLIRDASASSAAGFAPRVIFALPDVADDEPFGSSWPGAAPLGPVTPTTQLVLVGAPAVLAAAAAFAGRGGLDLSELSAAASACQGREQPACHLASCRRRSEIA